MTALVARPRFDDSHYIIFDGNTFRDLLHNLRGQKDFQNVTYMSNLVQVFKVSFSTKLDRVGDIWLSLQAICNKVIKEKGDCMTKSSINCIIYISIEAKKSRQTSIKRHNLI